MSQEIVSALDFFANILSHTFNCFCFVFFLFFFGGGGGGGAEALVNTQPFNLFECNSGHRVQHYLGVNVQNRPAF